MNGTGHGGATGGPKKRETEQHVGTNRAARRAMEKRLGRKGRAELRERLKTAPVGGLGAEEKKPAEWHGADGFIAGVNDGKIDHVVRGAETSPVSER